MLSIKEKLHFLDHSSRSIEAVEKISSQLFDAAHLSKLNAHSVGDDNCFFILREKSYPLDFSHGGHTLAEFLTLAPRKLALVSKNLAISELFPQDYIFFDTETTGLAGGSGTYIFLLGVGFYRDNTFIIRQYFLPDYKNEAYFLNAVLKEFKTFKGLISYNGKSYDVPLLKTRFIMNRMPFQDFDEKVHLDLLHPARRLWKKSVGPCSLQSIEKNVLGFARENDVPGGDIPNLYFNFMRNKQFEPLVPVLKHNVIDILTMIAIALSAAAAFDEKRHVDHKVAFDPRAVFHSFAALGENRKALLFAESAATDKNTRLKIDRAFLLKRMGEFEKAQQAWKNLLADKAFIEIAYLELAKYYEHTAKSYNEALKIIDAAMNRIEITQALYPDGKSVTIENWDYRKQRVLRKLAVGVQRNDN